MDPATMLAIIILIAAIMILLYYYLQSTNNPIYERVHTQAAGFSARVGQEPYVANFSEKVSDFGGKIKDRVQDEDEDEEHVSKTDLMSKKISQFIDNQSEQVIEDWNLVTHNDLDSVLEKYESLKDDLESYKSDNDVRVSDLEERVGRIDAELKELKD